MIGKARMVSSEDEQDYLPLNKKKRSRNYDSDDSSKKLSTRKKHKKHKKHKKKKKKKKSRRYDSDTESVRRRYDSEEEEEVPSLHQDNANKEEYNEKKEPDTKKKVEKMALSWYAKLKLAESKKEVGTVHSTGQPKYINIGTGANSERK